MDARALSEIREMLVISPCYQESGLRELMCCGREVCLLSTGASGRGWALGRNRGEPHTRGQSSDVECSGRCLGSKEQPGRAVHQCHMDPDLAFEGGALQLIQRVSGGLSNKKACVIGSGDHMAAIALAGLGAEVTSTDISEERLAMGSRRAERLGLSISFVRSDAACQESLADSSFDLVCSTNATLEVPGAPN